MLQEVHVHLRAHFSIYIAGRPTSNYMFWNGKKMTSDFQLRVIRHIHKNVTEVDIENNEKSITARNAFKVNIKV